MRNIKDQDDPKAPFIVDKDSDPKVMKWSSILLDYLFCTFGSRGPLSFVLCDDVGVPSGVHDPLLPNAYYGDSGILLDKVTVRLLHTGFIYKTDNTIVFILIEKSSLWYFS